MPTRLVDQHNNEQFFALATATSSSVAGSSVAASLISANTARRKLSFYNASTAILYLKKTVAADAPSVTTSLNFSVAIPASSLYEDPQPVYLGAYHGVWASTAGQVNITEEVV